MCTGFEKSAPLRNVCEAAPLVGGADLLSARQPLAERTVDASACEAAAARLDKGGLVRVYLAPDVNTLLCVADKYLRSRDLVNVIIAGKDRQPQWFSMAAAIKHCEAGIGILEWASNDQGGEPDVGLACAGDVPTLETLAGNLHVRGYKECGTTTTPFDMVVLNELDRFHLVMDVIDRVPDLGYRAAHLRQLMRDKITEHHAYIIEHGEDMPEVRDWVWQHQNDASAGI